LAARISIYLLSTPLGAALSRQAARRQHVNVYPATGFELKKPLVAKIAELLQNSLPRS